MAIEPPITSARRLGEGEAREIENHRHGHRHNAAAGRAGGQGFEQHEMTTVGAPTRLQIIGGGSEVDFDPLTLGAVR